MFVQGFACCPFVGDLVEAVAEAFGQAAGVGEHDRGAVGLDEVGDALLHVGPDRGAFCALGAVGHRGAAQFAQVLHGDHDGQVEFLAGFRLDDLHLAARGEVTGDLVDRADGRGEADAAGRLREEFVEAFEGEGEVGAAFGARDGVHLVEDHRFDAGQRVAGGRRQHQEQGLRGGDQDVRGAGGKGAALGGGGVAGADAHLDLGLREAEADGFLADAGQGAAEVALHVDREGLEGET